MYGGDHLSAVSSDGGHRHLSDVLLPADGELRVQRYEISGVRCSFWDVDEEHAPLGRARHGDRGLAAYAPGVPDRVLQTPSRVQLGRGGDPAGSDAHVELHRISPSLGPTVDVGGDGGDEYGQSYAVRGTRRPFPPSVYHGVDRCAVHIVGRDGGRAARAAQVLCPALHLHPVCSKSFYDRSFLENPEGRRHLEAPLSG